MEQSLSSDNVLGLVKVTVHRAIEVSWSPGEDDLSFIIQELEPVAHMWREIGLFLGLRDSTLEGIARGQGNEIVLLRVMIAKWLKMNYNVTKFGDPTWRRIVEAVGARTGGSDPALANELAKNHGVTTLERQPARSSSTLSNGRRVTNSTAPRHVHRGILHCCCYSMSSPAHALSDLTEDDFLVQNPTTETKITEITLPRRASETGSTLSGYSKFAEDIQQSTTVSAHPTWEIQDIAGQKGYWGKMTQKSAEKNLRECGGNCYLIRYSESMGDYVISVIRRDAEEPSHVIQHYKLYVTKEKDHTVYEIEGTENKFTSIAELLEFYQNTPLTRSNRTIGNVCTKISKKSN